MDEMSNYRKMGYGAVIVGAIALSGLIGYSLKSTHETPKQQPVGQNVIPKDPSPQDKKEESGGVEEIIEKSKIKVQDGDNIIYNGINHRLAAIDAPEIANSQGGWGDQYGTGQFKDINFGQKAKECLTEIIKNGTDIHYISIGKELYGRDWGYLIVDGKLVAIILVEKGLAYENHSHFKNPIRSDLGEQVTAVYKDTYKDGDKPHFEEPYLFRKRHKEDKKAKQQKPKDEKKKRKENHRFYPTHRRF